MGYRFTLQVTRVECIGEQANEWGKDEMRLFGFGVSRKGVFFATGYRNLGSYGDGDVQSSGIFPMMLFEGQLDDDGLDVLFYFWFVEEDGGGVRKAASALEAEFRDSYFEKVAALTEIQCQECIAFIAFYQATLPFRNSIEEAATDGRNDEVYAAVDLLLRHDNDLPVGLDSTKEITVQRSKRLGHYKVNLRYSYSRDVVVIE